MKCFVCATNGKPQEAVAVCAVCGKGLCLDHLYERNLPLSPRVSGWANKEAIHILCESCTIALPVALKE